MKRFISVSRRTDIPAVYSEWFLNRIKEGLVGYVNPFFKTIKRPVVVSLKPEDVLCFVFWSKDYGPFLESLKIIDDMGYNSIFHFTVTGLPTPFEPNVPETEAAIDTLRGMSERYSPRHITWRYDPIIISDKTDLDFHIQTFSKIASSLEGYVERCAFSYAKRHPKVRENFRIFEEKKGISITDPDTNTRIMLAGELTAIAEKYGIEMHTCCGDYLISDKIKKARCIDGDLIRALFALDGAKIRVGALRKECGCAASTDIGAYDTCPHGCVYCYANVNKDEAMNAYKDHDPGSAFLRESKSDSDKLIAEFRAKKQQNTKVKVGGKARMIVKRGNEGDYHMRYRPCRVSEVYGQEAAKKIIGNGLKDKSLSHTLLFHGDSGTGKTTFARIIAMGLLCDTGPTSEPCCECDSCKRVLKNNHLAFFDINTADDRGINDVRQLKNYFDTYSFDGSKYQVFLLDESHQLTQDAQQLLLKPTESLSNSHNYIIFSSTEPKKFKETLSNRCISIEFKPIPDDEIKKLLEDVCKWERIKYDDDVLDSIVEEAGGMARNALNLLQKAVALGTVEKMANGKVESIDREKGSNVLIVAPHGVYHDDDYTGLIAKHLADHLEGCAVINEKYQKPKTVGFEEPDLDRDLVDLNCWDQIHKYDQVKKEFLDPIDTFKNKIIKEHGEALIIQVHGISDDHMDLVAKNVNGYKRNPKNLHVLIGYGQSNGAKQRLTADVARTVQPLIECLKANKMNAAIAPIKPIRGNDGNEKTYCGSDPDGLNQKLYNPNGGVQCVQLEIRKSGFREHTDSAQEKAEVLGKALSELVQTKPEKVDIAAAIPVAKSAPVKKVKFCDIVVGKPNDGQYIFRVTSDDENVKKRQEAEIQELADSIRNNGLVHPLVLIQNSDGKYKILCGFRRFQALKRLGKEEVEARVYREEDLTDEQRMLISLAENKDRRDLNPVEIGNYLQCAKDRLKLSEKKLASKFGEMLGIGTSHSSVNKYVKLNQIRVKGESQKIINDVLKRKLQFGVAAEVLAFIDNAEDRNALHKELVKPLRPTKPELINIKNVLREIGNGKSFKSTLAKKEVKNAIKQAQESEHKGQKLIELLKPLIDDPLTKQIKDFEGKVETLRQSVLGEGATEEEFNVIAPPGMEKNEITVQFKITDENFEATVDKIRKLLDAEDFRQLLDSVVSP